MCFSPLPVQGTLQVPRGGGLVSEIDLKSSEKAWNESKVNRRDNYFKSWQ